MRTPIDLIVAKYIHEMEADRAKSDIKEFDKQIIDLAVVIKDKNGDLTIKDRDDLDPVEGKNTGALIGGIIGISFGPAGLLGAAIGAGLGIAAGAITGRIVASQVDTGFKDEVLTQLTKDMEPTSSALFLVCEEVIGDQLIDKLNALKADIKRYDLNLKFDEKANKQKA